MTNNTKDTYQKLFGRYTKPKMKAFLKFHHDNPQVWAKFKELANRWRDAGKKKCSAALLGNVLRWQCSLETQSEDGFKINNDWLPMYARILAFHDESFLEFFDFRGL